MKRANIYEHDITTIKQLGQNKVKVTYVSSCRIKGIETEKTCIPKYTVNTEKLDNNICRAKTKVQETVLCNDWDYWCTFTISPDKYDRYNLKQYITDLGEFIHSYNRRCVIEDKVKYILIPEMHKDGAWHLHGFIKGIKKQDLYVNQYGFLTWKQYEDKFGFISMSDIKDIDKAASYSLKYMTKDIAKSVTEMGAHLYYCSKGLKKPELIYKGQAKIHCEWDYEHPDGYCKIKTFDTRYQELGEYIEVI